MNIDWTRVHPSVGWLSVIVWSILVGFLQLWGYLFITRRRDDLRSYAEHLDEYAGQLDDWAREIKVARINLSNLVTHAERYAEGHEATRAMFTRIVERLHEKLPEEEAEDGGD